MTKGITVLYHRDADGFGAAFALWNKYGSDATYKSVQYGEGIPTIADGTQKLFIVDFSYPREVCEKLASKYDLTVIDHHKTAQSELEGLPYAIFDTTKSGAVLTWETVFPDREVPSILLYVQDRDLWQFKLPKSEEVNLAISATKEDFGVWEMLSIEDAMETGNAIKAFRDSQIRHTVRSASQRSFLGHIAVVSNCSANISEAGHVLLKEFPDAKFAVLYCDRSDGMRSYSLRSRGDFDVSEVAKTQGGGGHPASSGFIRVTPLDI